MTAPRTRTPNCHTPSEPKLSNEEQREQKTQYSILAGSEVNRALWRVKEAAEELEAMIELFQDAYDNDMSGVVSQIVRVNNCELVVL